MKYNRWTICLTALGLVSPGSVIRAEEKANAVQTALASTTISGYVDTSAQWNFGTGNANVAPYKFNSPSKSDGFNLDVVQIRIDKPLDEADWAAGYRVDLWAGPDANVLGTQSTLSSGSSDFAIRQAYVLLQAPLGNGLTFKLGVFDSIIGYESVESPNDPNYTRSYGHSIEPQTHTGVLASYRFTDLFRVSAGVADTVGPAINSRAQSGSAGFTSGPFQPYWNALYAAVPTAPIPGSDPRAESYKTYMGSFDLTAPDTMGVLAGSTLYAGIVNGYNDSAFGSGVGDVETSYYVGGTIATPMTNLRLGAAFDYLDLGNVTTTATTGGNTIHFDGNAFAVAGYASLQATEKLSLHGRVEYTETKLDFKMDGTPAFPDDRLKIFALTGTAQYDLWKNVLTRLELRWDHSANGHNLFGGDTAGVPQARNAWMLAANVIYKF